MARDSYFVVIEGLDGAGKSIIARHLRDALTPAHADNVALTYEPHDPSATGAHIRKVLAKQVKVSPLSLAYAFAHNRIDHLDKVVNPHLAAGDQRIVVCDRYLLSSLVYQSTGDLSMDDIYHLNRWARRPDLTIYLCVSPHNGYSRMRMRPNDRELFERNLSERAQKYQAGIALLRDKGERIVEVDANGTIAEVFDAVVSALKQHGPGWMRIQPPLLFD